MLAELRVKSQITLPKDIVTSVGLSEGDKLDVFVRDGVICMVPVVVYPKRYVDELQSELAGLREKIESGEQPVFDSIDALIDKLDEE